MALSAYELILHIITVVTIVFQLYLFYLIQYHSPKSMANYTWFLNYFTLCDLMFSVLMGAFLQPDPTGYMMTFKFYGICSFIGPKAEIIGACAVFYFGANVFLSQDFCLLYRYSAILESKRLHEMFLTKRMKFVLFFGAQCFTLGVFFFCYNLIVRPEQFFDETFETQRMAPLRAILAPNEFVIMPVVDSKAARVFMALVLTFFLSSELFCCFLVYSILSTLKKTSSTFSKNTYRLHYQLTLLLAVQLAIPLFLIIIPISIRWGFVLFTGREVSAFNNFRMILVTLYGLCNSCFTVLFVVPYRAHLYNTFIFPIIHPIAKMLHLKGWEPRRKSITWAVSGTRRNIMTVAAKSSVFLSD